MDRDKQREIASKGGKAAHAKGRAHEWTVDEAREAGRKGGSSSHRQSQTDAVQGDSRRTEDNEPPVENTFTHVLPPDI
jgi:hypothetical protein